MRYSSRGQHGNEVDEERRPRVEGCQHGPRGGAPAREEQAVGLDLADEEVQLPHRSTGNKEDEEWYTRAEDAMFACVNDGITRGFNRSHMQQDSIQI